MYRELSNSIFQNSTTETVVFIPIKCLEYSLGPQKVNKIFLARGTYIPVEIVFYKLYHLALLISLMTSYFALNIFALNTMR